MIYSDDLTHIVTEEGIAYLHKCTTMAERMAAIRAVAGFTSVGMQEDPAETAGCASAASSRRRPTSASTLPAPTAACLRRRT